MGRFRTEDAVKSIQLPCSPESVSELKPCVFCGHPNRTSSCARRVTSQVLLDTFLFTLRDKKCFVRRFLLPLRLRPARPEALVGKICRDGDSDPANPNWHGHVFHLHMPTEEEANRMAESYQRKHCSGDEGKDSWCHSPPLRIKNCNRRGLQIPRRCLGESFKQRLGTS
jgi:hypothetical protein